MGTASIFSIRNSFDHKCMSILSLGSCSSFSFCQSMLSFCYRNHLSIDGFVCQNVIKHACKCQTHFVSFLRSIYHKRNIIFTHLLLLYFWRVLNHFQCARFQFFITVSPQYFTLIRVCALCFVAFFFFFFEMSEIVLLMRPKTIQMEFRNCFVLRRMWCDVRLVFTLYETTKIHILQTTKSNAKKAAMNYKPDSNIDLNSNYRTSANIYINKLMQTIGINASAFHAL